MNTNLIDKRNGIVSYLTRSTIKNTHVLLNNYLKSKRYWQYNNTLIIKFNSIIVFKKKKEKTLNLPVKLAYKTCGL